MATRTSQTTDKTLGAGPNEGAAHNGLKFERIHYTNIANEEVITPGSRSIVEAWFKPDSADDDVNVVVLTSEIVQFNVGIGGPHSGTVLLGTRGY